MIDISFSIAKHIPDLQRLEPKNIGLVAWSSDGTVAARFLGERPDGGIDSPPFMSRRLHDAYRQWIFSWRHAISQPAIRNKAGEMIARESPDFLPALREKSKESFQLVDAGVLRSEDDQMEHVVADLYERLVTPKVKKRLTSEASDLSKLCTEIFRHTGIARRSDYRPHLPIARRVYGVIRDFTADYALGPANEPTAVMQKVLLTRHQSIDSSAFMFHALANDDTHPISAENCMALVNTRHAMDQASRSGLRMLEKVATVVDVSDHWAEKKLREMSERTQTTPN